jgi:four helix bundle protein
MKDENKKPVDLRVRTKQLALRIIRLYAALPKTVDGQVVGKQLLRAGTSVGAHYREAARARSDAEFISKLEGGLQELDEAAYWMELLSESGIMAPSRLAEIQNEVEELIAIFTTCVKKVKQKGMKDED